jgi:hypothetical protein
MARKIKKKASTSVTKSSASQYKITPSTTYRGLQSMRVLSKPKHVRLFQDQLELMALIEEQLGRQVNTPDVIRDGLDLMLQDIVVRFKIKVDKK